MSNASREIDIIVQSAEDWKGQLLAELRSLIVSTSPEIEEAVKWKMPSKPLGSPTWGANGIVCVADYLKMAVRLTFPKGAKINDPSGLFNARLDSKVARAIDFPEGCTIDASGLQNLVAEAIKANK